MNFGNLVNEKLGKSSALSMSVADCAGGCNMLWIMSTCVNS